MVVEHLLKALAVDRAHPHPLRAHALRLTLTNQHILCAVYTAAVRTPTADLNHPPLCACAYLRPRPWRR